MTTYKLQQIANWRACHVNVPDGYEIEAVVETVLDGWADPDLVRQTAVNGVHQSDREWIAEIIRDHNLRCSVSECVEALKTECRNRYEKHTNKMITIKHRYSGSVLFSLETDTLKHAVEEAVRQRINLSFADLKEADLRGADLKGANFYRANLYKANLKKANLGGAILEGADLKEADLYRANLNGAYLYRTNFKGANLGRTNLIRADLEDVNLDGAYLEGADGVKLNLVGDRPLLTIGPIGSRSDYLNAILTDHGLYLKTGCFFGTRDAFVKAITKTHKGNENEREYRAALTLIEMHADLWTPKAEVV